MSNLPGNPHEEDAMMYSCEASEIQAHEDHERLILAQQATTHATLALAYEQRNVALAIIAASTHPDGTYALDPAVVDKAQDQLKARLGLGDNNA